MAIWNEILEGSLNQLLVKRLAMQTGSPTPAISPELQATIVLENDRPEFSFLKGELLLSGYVNSPAVAAQNSWVALSNPVGSNALATVTMTLLQCAAGAAWYRTIAVPGTLGVSVPRDFRQSFGAANFSSSLQVNASSIAGLPPVGLFSNATVGGVAEYSRVIILPPNTGLQIFCTTVNTEIRVTFDWRERALLPGELS